MLFLLLIGPRSLETQRDSKAHGGQRRERAKEDEQCSLSGAVVEITEKL